jgi:ABC-2 type transport system ATP-binding protein
MADLAVRTTGLTKRYGHTVGLDALTLDVPTGVVFGYLGPNGSGKTTTIRLLMGLLRPTRGRAEILGMDVTADRGRVHARAGYLPGEFVAFPDLTGRQYLRHLASLRGGVSWPYTDALAERFELDLGRRIGELSHGNRQKIGLVQAFMHEPDVLVLDEPTSGLDPLMQREFRALIGEQQAAGRTVFLSSHLLDEVEAVADIVAILRDGRLLVVEAVDELKAKARRSVRLTFDGDPPTAALRGIEAVRDLHVEGRSVSLTVEGTMAELFRVAAPYGIDAVVTHEAGLEEIFLDYYSSGGRAQ